MIGIKDFIVHIPNKYNEKYKTEGGLELYADHRWSNKELANTVVEVIEVPLGYEGPIKKGGNIFVDSTLVSQQIYRDVVQDSPYLVDRVKLLYKVDPSLIILYSDGDGTEWKAFNDNVILEDLKKKEVEEHKIGSIIIPSVAEKIDRTKRKILIANEDLKNEGIEMGDVVFIDEQSVVDVYLRGKKFGWVQNKHIYAIELKEAI